MGEREKATAQKVAKLLAEQFGLDVAVVGDTVRVSLPDYQAQKANDSPPVTAAVTPSKETGPVAPVGPFSGKLAGHTPAFISAFSKAILDVCAEVSIEAMSATDKHGLFTSPHEGHSVIREELEELFDEIRANNGKKDSARHEALQIAATAVKYVLMLGPPFGSARLHPDQHAIAIELSNHV